MGWLSKKSRTGRESGVDEDIGTEAPDEESFSGVGERAKFFGCRAAIAIHAEVGHGGSAGEGHVGFAEADEGNGEQSAEERPAANLFFDRQSDQPRAAARIMGGRSRK